MSNAKVTAIVNQLVWCLSNGSGYVSDGSMHKAMYGALVSMQATPRGLQLTIACEGGKQRVCMWRMSRTDAVHIIDTVEQETGVVVSPQIEVSYVAVSQTSTRLADDTATDNAAWFALNCRANVSSF